MMRSSLVLGAGLLWALALWAEAPGPAGVRDMDAEDLAAFVDGFVTGRMKSEDVAGVTVSVVHSGEVIFARGYGYADVEARRPVAADRTLFRPGSISKTFTWTAVMQLYEQGKLALDEDIRTYLPNLEIGDEFEEPITLLHLMAHTPGYEDSAMGHLFGNDPDRVPALLDYLRAHRPARVAPPGERPAYSNYGVALAGLVVANVSGMAWEDYVERHLLEPLGMHSSTFREPWSAAQPAPMPAHLTDNVSRGYRRHDGGFEPGTFTFISQVGPAGAMSTTATDMARWMLAHLNDGRLGGVKILEPETAQLMHRQHYTVDADMPGMAHGFIESRVHGYRAIGHGGGTIYFLSDMQLVPDLGLGVFISTNTSGGGGALISEFVDTLAERYFPPGPLAVEEGAVSPVRPLEAYAGTYLSTRRPYTTVERLFMTTAANVSAAEGYLVVTAPGLTTRLVPAGPDTFTSADTGARIKFTSRRGEEIDTLLLPMSIMVMEKAGILEDPKVLYAILAAAAVVMILAVVGAWLRRRRGVEETRGEAWASRVAVLTALAWITVYVVGLFALAPLAGDLANAFFGFPSAAFVAALILTLAAAALTVVAAVLLVPVWVAGSWGMWRRIRHTVVVLAALATLLVLYDFNAVGFNYLPG